MRETERAVHPTICCRWSCPSCRNTADRRGERGEYGGLGAERGICDEAARLGGACAGEDIKTLLTPPKFLDLGAVTVARAAEICRFVNQVCSEQAKAINGNDSTISPNCHVLLLDKTGVHPAQFPSSFGCRGGRDRAPR